MNRTSLAKLIFWLSFLSGLTCQGEIFYSLKYGFIAEFSAEPEKIEAPAAAGDIANFWVTTEKPFLVLTVSAQKMKDYIDFVEKPLSEALQKRLLQVSFDSFRKVESLGDIKLEWVKNTAFPVLKASFSQIGLIGEKVKSYELSYWMLLGDTFYRVKAQGVAPTELEDQIKDLYKSFMIVDSEVLGLLMKSAKKPATLRQ